MCQEIHDVLQNDHGICHIELCILMARIMVSVHRYKAFMGSGKRKRQSS